tara:strand:+ start:2660 stop:2803 length:144 start_codon:yes stop_codon:yes gene_type:complete
LLLGVFDMLCHELQKDPDGLMYVTVSKKEQERVWGMHPTIISAENTS